MLLPKPKGELDKLFTTPVLRQEQQAVNYIRRMLAGADLLDIETVNALGHVTRWLLLPVGHAELDWLATVGADSEDLEDDDIEKDASDDEPSLGASNVGAANYDQTSWRSGGSDDDCELDRSDYEPDADDGDIALAITPDIVRPRQVRRPRLPVHPAAD